MTTPSEGLTILVSGRIAGAAGQGGAVWAVLQYLLGFRRLGHDVYFVEPLGPDDSDAAGGRSEDSAAARWFLDVVGSRGMEDRAALILPDRRETLGMSYSRLSEVANRTDVLVNLSGVLRDPEIVEPCTCRLYMDLDPGFTQLWQAAEGVDMGLDGHTHFVTVGLALGDPECPIPTCGRRWIPTLPPVVLDDWPVVGDPGGEAFTTVANWRSYGSIRHGGLLYGQKAHSLRRFADLPARTGYRFDLALTIDPGETEDLRRLEAGGWTLVDPDRAAGTPDRYRRFIASSRAEFGIAKSGYVEARCGWFSDRSACYLARGRPVLAQETGYTRYLPSGVGLLQFATNEEAEAGIEAIHRDWPAHAKAARAIAESCLDSDMVLGGLLRNVGVAP